MLEIEKPKIECIEHSDDWSYAKLVMEPLEPSRTAQLSARCGSHKGEDRRGFARIFDDIRSS